MPHKTEWEPKGICRKFSGKISADEILESNFSLHADPRFLTARYVINDFTGISEILVNPVHTEIYAKTDNIIAKAKGKMKIALVVSNPAYLPLAENYRALMQDSLFDCEIFPDIDTARNWTAA